MPRTNRTQKYAALWLHSQGWDVSKISNELDLTDTQVKRIVKEVQSENKMLNRLQKMLLIQTFLINLKN